jgi:hypothetical protein
MVDKIVDPRPIVERGPIKTVDFAKIPGVVDIMDDSMIGTEARKAFDKAVKVIAKNLCDDIDKWIIDEHTE